MAEPGAIRAALKSWIKAGVTSVIGLVSGAFLLYLTPVINKTIKPAVPLANFAAQANGLTVTFNDHSAGGVSGWWDFGDGTELVPYGASQGTIAHTYDKPASYNVKLALQNLIGEENDRTVTINLDGTASSLKPEIKLFEVQAITPAECAPAVYRVACEVKNASYCILATGDDSPLQVDEEVTKQERYVTFKESGDYTIRLAVVNGKEIVEKTKTVHVKAGETGGLIAKLSVSYEAMKYRRKQRTIPVTCKWTTAGNDSTSPFRAERVIDRDYTILNATITNQKDPNAPVRNLKLDIAPEKNRFILSGELVRSFSVLTPDAAPSWRAEVQVDIEKRSAPIVVNPPDVTMPVAINSTMKIPMQPLEDSWKAVRTQAKLELWDGATKVWEGNMAANAALTLKNRPCLVTVAPERDGMRLTIIPATSPAMPAPAATSPLHAVTPPPAVFAPMQFEPLQVAPPAAPSVPLVVRPASFERLPAVLLPKGN